MADPVRLGLLGATGRVGRTAVDLIERHLKDKFVITYLAASSNSANKKYGEAISGRPVVGVVPAYVANMIVQDSNEPDNAVGKCDMVLSAVEISDKDKEGRPLTPEEKNQGVRDLEDAYADRGIFVVSANSAHRWTKDVAVLIPEINSGHLGIIPYQRRARGWDKGALIAKPNCSEQSFMLPVYALTRAGYVVSDMIVVTEQGLSGAGDGGDSVVSENRSRKPYIKGEQEKTQKEPLKIFGTILGGEIVSATLPRIGSKCNRDNVLNGHSANLFIKFACKTPSLDEIIQIWNNFKPDYSTDGLCLAPEQPIVYINEHGRPRPDADLMTGKGMTVSMGELEKCALPLFDIQCTGFSHNMIRGAAGGALYGAELCIAKGYFIR